MSHKAEIFPGSESFSVYFISGIKKVWIKEERGVSMFPVEIFCLTVLRNFIEETLCNVFEKIYCSEKFYGYKGGGRESRFCLENSLSHSAENSLGKNPLVFH